MPASLVYISRIGALHAGTRLCCRHLSTPMSPCYGWLRLEVQEPLTT
jgi:hypothetical protein